METTEKTLLVITPGNNVSGDSIFYLLVAQTGEVLCSHFCSGSGGAKSDLYSNRPERVEEFRNRFGEVEVKFINQTDITEEELLARNQKWFESQPKE